MVCRTWEQYMFLAGLLIQVKLVYVSFMIGRTTDSDEVDVRLSFMVDTHVGLLIQVKLVYVKFYGCKTTVDSCEVGVRL